MAHSSVSQDFIALARSFSKPSTTYSLTQCLTPRLLRSFASHATIPAVEMQQTQPHAEPSTRLSRSASSPISPESASVLTTLYNWPSIEPSRYALYSSKHLDVPLRRDLLHRAVIYEADATRAGTASTKWRDEVRGSGKKIRPQKGTGRARLGDKKSPMLRGGGVAFGPKPRDFSTDLPRKVYDIAWRTALSYRYRKGELIVLDGEVSMPEGAGARLLNEIFVQNQWGKPNRRSLMVTLNVDELLYDNMGQIGEHGVVKDIEDVDVKDLLTTGRVIIEKQALDTLLAAHSSDLGSRMSLAQAILPESHETISQYA